MGWTDRVAEHREIGIVVERHAIASEWAAHRWHPGAVLLDVPDTAPWTRLSENGGISRFYAGPAMLTLVPSETESYLYNLTSPEPQLWIVLRPAAAGESGCDVALEAVTAAVGEAEVLSGSGDLVVEAVPMPQALIEWVAGFARDHPVAAATFKRKRNRHVSEGQALAERLAGREAEDE